MKQQTIILALLLLAFTCQGQTTITGNLQSMEGWSPEIYLLAISEYDDVFLSTNKYNIDTAFVETNGNFSFSLNGLPCTECLYRIDVRPKGATGAIILGGSSKENYALFELRDQQHIHITGKASQLTKTFSLSKNERGWSFEEIRKLRDPVYEVADQIADFFSSPKNLKGLNIDSLQSASMEKIVASLETNNSQLLAYVKSTGNIYDKIIGAKVYDYDFNMENDLPVYESINKQLEELNIQHSFLRQLKDNIHEAKYILPTGTKAPDINLPDTSGQILRLEDIGDNLILVDFWASWCSPCRLENRTTVAPLYERFKDRGFTVYSVSLDDKRGRWLQAIAQDGMKWNNVSDLLGNKSPIYTTYKIDGLPTTYLIEKSSMKILAKNIRAKELEAFVSKYYKQ